MIETLNIYKATEEILRLLTSQAVVEHMPTIWKSIPEERKAQLVCYNMSKLKARQHLNT